MVEIAKQQKMCKNKQGTFKVVHDKILFLLKKSQYLNQEDEKITNIYSSLKVPGSAAKWIRFKSITELYLSRDASHCCQCIHSP